MNKRKGFTLIELLAVIVILGLLMAIAIPSVTKYITQSRKKTVVSTMGNYIGSLVNDVNDLTYTFTGSNTVYAVPIECIALERGGTNPFGVWHQASNAYWAYVLVQYDDINSSYTYGYTFKDSAGYGIYPTSQAKLHSQGKQIQTGLDLSRPQTGKVTSITATTNWNGFKVDDSTNLVVLEAESEGDAGDGKSTCTLQQKGDNYASVEQEKAASIKNVKIGKLNFQYKEGMTWEDWINSKYNTTTFMIYRNYIFDDDVSKYAHLGELKVIEYGYPVVTDSEMNDDEWGYKEVRPTEKILENVLYSFRDYGRAGEIAICFGKCIDEINKYIYMDSNGNLTYIEN